METFTNSIKNEINLISKDNNKKKSTEKNIEIIVDKPFYEKYLIFIIIGFIVFFY